MSIDLTVDFDPANIQDAIRNITDDDKNILTKRWKFSFRKSNLKKSNSANTQSYFTRSEISFLLYFAQLANTNLYFVPTAGRSRSSVQSLQLFLQIVKNRARPEEEIGSIHDLLLLCCTEFKDDKFQQFQATNDYAMYDEVKNFDCYQFLNGDALVFNDDDDEDEDLGIQLSIEHTQDEIDGEEPRPLGSLFNGLRYSLSSNSTQSSSQSGSFSSATINQQRTNQPQTFSSDLMNFINSQGNNPVFDEKVAEDDNLIDLVDSLRVEADELLSISIQGNDQFKRSTVLSALVANIIMFGFKPSLPASFPLIEFVKIFAKINNDKEALQFITNIKSNIFNNLKKEKVIDEYGTLINLSIYTIMLKNRVFPPLLLKKFSPSVLGKRGRSGASIQSTQPRKRSRQQQNQFFNSSINNPRYNSSSSPFQFSTPISNQSSSNTPNAITKTDLDNFKRDITLQMMKSHDQLKHEMDKQNKADCDDDKNAKHEELPEVDTNKCDDIVVIEGIKFNEKELKGKLLTFANKKAKKEYKNKKEGKTLLQLIKTRIKKTKDDLGDFEFGKRVASLDCSYDVLEYFCEDIVDEYDKLKSKKNTKKIEHQDIHFKQEPNGKYKCIVKQENGEICGNIQNTRPAWTAHWQSKHEFEWCYTCNTGHIIEK